MTKDYFLKETRPTTEAPASVARAMTWAKATNEITGLIRGILADGVVAESEAVFLRAWIRDRPELLCDSLVRSLACRVERIFADGIVTPDELIELKEILSEFSPEGETPTQLPLDRPAPVVIIAAKNFCFTGTFVSGTRKWCEEQITTRGGGIQNLPAKFPHYLVIGSKISGAWRNQTYGKKIESAMAARETKYPVSIINEDHWLAAITT